LRDGDETIIRSGLTVLDTTGHLHHWLSCRQHSNKRWTKCWGQVTERPEFIQQFAAIRERLNMGELSKRKAAKELAIGYATLDRLLDNPPLSPAVIECINSVKPFAEVLY
jgi:hypothetical protein